MLPCINIFSVLQAMEKSELRSFLIDGFPRNKDNLEGWNTVMAGVSEVKRVLFFNCEDQVIVNLKYNE